MRVEMSRWIIAEEAPRIPRSSQPRLLLPPPRHLRKLVAFLEELMYAPTPCPRNGNREISILSVCVRPRDRAEFACDESVPATAGSKP